MQKTPVLSFSESSGACLLSCLTCRSEESARCGGVLRCAILLTGTPEHPLPVCSVPSRKPTFQWRTFIPAAFAASVHPCAYSAVRVGLSPFLLNCLLPACGLYGRQPHSISGPIYFLGSCIYYTCSPDPCQRAKNSPHTMRGVWSLWPDSNRRPAHYE